MMIPSDLSAQEYIINSTEEDEQEAEARLRLCTQCPTRGGQCEGMDHEGTGPLWRGSIVWHPCIKWRIHALDRRMLKSGYPARLLGWTFETFDAYTPELEKVLRGCRNYVRKFGDPNVKDPLKPGHGLLLGGDCGTGKTHLAVSVATELHRQRKIRTSHFWDTEFLVFLLRQHTEESRQAVEASMEADLLVLDDFNVVGATDWAAAQLAMVINHRWGAELPTLVTTNEHLDKQEKIIGERAISRLIGASIGIEVLGRDYRID